jgi:anaerobic selenocysteine-containing dehydrogenase
MAPLDTSAKVSDEVAATTCYMCACRCGILVHLKDGQVRYIEGNPDHPVNKGVLCGKGAAGIMQHLSPARLRAPLLRTGERGRGEFKEISWDEALALATQWLGEVREKDPKRLAFFTGRDQSQSLTGLWAIQYGTPNYAAHGGFCSVNMAAAGLYTLGGSFWEFGEPDWERTEYFLLFGVAEDHASNPIKSALGKLKKRGAKIVAVNPVRTGYGAIADEWLGITPGTDGLFVSALIRELLVHQEIDLDYLVRYTNAPWLVVDAPGTAEHGLFARDSNGRALVHDLATGQLRGAPQAGLKPALTGRRTLADGRSARPVLELIAARYLDPRYAPEAVADTTGIAAATIRRIAAELAEAAFAKEIRLKQPWTDWTGETHAEMIGRPVSMHAMRGISAHANGFHTCRLIHILQTLLGSIDCPGGFRYKPPYPKPVPPPLKPFGKPGQVKPREPLGGPHLGFPTSPADLLVDEDGRPSRIDKAFSWDAPFAAHGLMHMVITNTAMGDPYPIDLLFLYMANMSWNSSMNVPAVLDHLTAKDGSGAYKIPRIIYSDAYASEMVAYADLVLPDTTYLERYDCISLLDRPISEADGPADAIRHPVVAPDRDVRGFQEVLIDLGTRLKLPAFTTAYGAPKYPGGYADYIVNHERAPGIGPLAGWRGEDGGNFGKGRPNPDQLRRYIEHGGFHIHHLRPEQRFFKHANKDYLEWATAVGFLPSSEPIVFQLYVEPMQRFRLAAEGLTGEAVPEPHRRRVARYFDPLPFWYPPEEVASAGPPHPGPPPPGGGGGELPNPPHKSDQHETSPPPSPSWRGAGGGGWTPPSANQATFPLHAITQRPMHMYHSWGTQNAWLRQITNENRLYIHHELGRRLGLEDDDWVWIASAIGRVKAPVKLMAGCNPETVWTWNAIGKRQGAWGLSDGAPETTKGFLLNHLIGELLPAREGGYRFSNSDPVTGQAAWYDLRVRLEKCSPEESRETSPRFEALGRPNNIITPGELRFGETFARTRQ